MSKKIVRRLRDILCLVVLLCAIFGYCDECLDERLMVTNLVVRNRKLESAVVERVREISQEQKDKARCLQEDYLISILEEKISIQSERYTAIVLLGKIKSAKAMRCLVKHIDYECVEYEKGTKKIDYPAQVALVEIGEESVPYLIAGIEEEGLEGDVNRKRSFFMVKTIMWIKNDDYQAFFEEAKTKYSKKVQEALKKCSIQ